MKMHMALLRLPRLQRDFVQRTASVAAPSHAHFYGAL